MTATDPSQRPVLPPLP